MILEVRHWAAALYQLMVMVDGKLVTGCPRAISPTLDATFVVMSGTSPFGGRCLMLWTHHGQKTMILELGWKE